jgi:hypothetical protein
MKVINSNLFAMPNGYPNPEGRYFWHLATIEDNFREYIATALVYSPFQEEPYIAIEEVVLVSNSNNQEVAANLKRITDETLLKELNDYLFDKRLTDMKTRYNEAIETGLLFTLPLF